MPLDAFLWMFLPLIVAGGSALLSFYITQARMEVLLSKEREALMEARSTINSQKATFEERVRAVEESTKRVALDEFMQDFRVEERSYGRESRSHGSSKKSMIMQERLFFRNIPLSNWIERELVIEEGKDLDQIERESVFSPAQVKGGGSSSNLPIPRGVDEVVISIPEGNPQRSLVSVYLTAFGSRS